MKPIIFNTPMVQAIDKDIKTSTRRIVKVDVPSLASIVQKDGLWCWSFWEDGDYHSMKQPYRIGDILYVRETWQEVYLFDQTKSIASASYYSRASHLNANTFITNWEYIPKISLPDQDNSFYLYKATDIHYLHYNAELKWCPAIHMPKQAARTFLRVTDIQPVLLKDITEEEALREGAKATSDGLSARDAFKEIWNSTISQEKMNMYNWDADPLVWAIDFEKISKADALKEVA